MQIRWEGQRQAAEVQCGWYKYYCWQLVDRLLPGVVYDCTGSEFFEEGGPYHLWAGKDATFALAKMSLDPTVTRSNNAMCNGVQVCNSVLLLCCRNQTAPTGSL